MCCYYFYYYTFTHGFLHRTFLISKLWPLYRLEQPRRADFFHQDLVASHQSPNRWGDEVKEEPAYSHGAFWGKQVLGNFQDFVQPFLSMFSLPCRSFFSVNKQVHHNFGAKWLENTGPPWYALLYIPEKTATGNLLKSSESSGEKNPIETLNLINTWIFLLLWSQPGKIHEKS